MTNAGNRPRTLSLSDVLRGRVPRARLAASGAGLAALDRRSICERRKMSPFELILPGT
jgi:hypothetical protein